MTGQSNCIDLNRMSAPVIGSHADEIIRARRWLLGQRVLGRWFLSLALLGALLCNVPWGDQLVPKGTSHVGSFRANASTPGIAPSASGVCADDPGEAISTSGAFVSLLRLDLRHLATASLNSIATTIAMAARWRLLLSAVACPLRFGDAVTKSFASKSFDLIGVGELGGEVWRAATVARHHRNLAGPVVAQTVERLCGLLVLMPTLALGLVPG